METLDHDEGRTDDGTRRPRTPLPLLLVGLRRRRGRGLPVRPTMWGWTIIVVVGVLVGGFAFAEYSMDPDFCRSCHIMEPYYQAWHESTHKNVPCGDCHFEPGWRHTLKGKFEASSQAVKYITNTYGSKPHAEVRDVSCLREECHQNRLLQGKVDWVTVTQSGAPITIQFDHTPHLENLRRGKELRCVSCHSQMVQGRHIAVTLDTCYTCHFKGLRHGREEDVLGGCRSCHAAPKEEIRLATGIFNHSDYVDRGVACFDCHSDSIKGDGDVPRQMCWTCHNQVQQVARYGEPNFIHRKHITENKVECSSCHVQIEHSLTAAVPRRGRAVGDGHMLDNSGSCGQCHDRTHAGPAELYAGIGGRGVPDMPSPMYRAQVDCIACHRVSELAGAGKSGTEGGSDGGGDGGSEGEPDVRGVTFTAAQRSCDGCHGSRYPDALELWTASISKLLDEADIAIDGARRHLAGADLSPQSALEARRRLADAEHNVRFVRFGHGVHNVNYATALLNVAMQKCREITGGEPWTSGVRPDPEAQLARGTP